MTAPDAVQVDVTDVIGHLTARIGADAHEIAGLRALIKQQGAELIRLERVNEALQSELANADGVAEQATQ
jgi:hypothetical protein